MVCVCVCVSNPLNSNMSQPETVLRTFLLYGASLRSFGETSMCFWLRQDFQVRMYQRQDVNEAFSNLTSLEESLKI